VFFQKNNDAVSPVIGTILMVAITVIIAANIAIFVWGMEPPKSTPYTSLMNSSTSPTYVKLEHQGGTDIILSYARIVVEQGGNRISHDILLATYPAY
jgi:flagellin-like protein